MSADLIEAMLCWVGDRLAAGNISQETAARYQQTIAALIRRVGPVTVTGLTTEQVRSGVGSMAERDPPRRHHPLRRSGRQRLLNRGINDDWWMGTPTPLSAVSLEGPGAPGLGISTAIPPNVVERADTKAHRMSRDFDLALIRRYSLDSAGPKRPRNVNS